MLITTGRSDWEGEEDFLGVQMPFSHFDEAVNRELITDSGFTVLFEDLHRGNSCGDDDRHPICLARGLVVPNKGDRWPPLALGGVALDSRRCAPGRTRTYGGASIGLLCILRQTVNS